MIPLPEPEVGYQTWTGQCRGAYTADQMHAHAAAARRQALEEAAQWYMRKHGGQPGTVGHAWAEIEVRELRSLIDKDTATSDAPGL